ncbi:hypothetical protein COCOR_06895 [Corallococcus coralloides DSM 2259]|uniref:Uncharacterized protein n=1 Tax=Corallococcus coralloides (strain ATCC 25202 / DSM 2259 / NBRC 100086 / M2) TaxID=1144275 RepID=H8N139_CORCM|nr:hypothetical protein [Corallococcus coralloides]AFE07204.1 hypothetical protein COCOR_06895 [Corallococcus coralloides DSM 2259]
MKSRQRATSGATQLQYHLDPTTLYMGDTVSLQLTITNPSQSALALERGYIPPRADARVGDGSGTTINVRFPMGDSASDLFTQGAASNVSCQSLDKLWACSQFVLPDALVFRIYPLQGSSLPPGGTVQIQFSNILVSNSQGAPVVRILEDIGGDDAQTTLSLLKQPVPLSIQAFADPPTVGLDQTTAIHWTASGGSEVVISGVGQPVIIPLEGPGPFYSQQTPVHPAQNTPQTTFTVSVVTPDKQQQSTQVSVQLSPPIIDVFSVSPVTPIDTDQSVSLQWSARYATQAFLRPSAGSGEVPVQGSKVLFPGKFLTDNSNPVVFTLSTVGYQPQPSKQLAVWFNPARILYFRYADLQTKKIEYDFVNGTASLAYGEGDLVTLSVTGPGGPLQQFLGDDNALAIQYFAASATTVSPGASVTLSFLVTQAQQIVLQPDNTQVTVDANGNGSTVVTPTQTTTYVLVATRGAQQVTSQLQITVQS